MEQPASNTSDDYMLWVTVVGHEKRAQMAAELCGNVEANARHIDDGTLGEWRNHENAWRQAATNGYSHAVILQDDAVPIPDFRAHVMEAVRQKPNDLISLYTGTHRPRKEEVMRAIGVARRTDASWLVADTLMWGVGVVVPVDLIDEILETIKKSRLPYDQRIGSWAQSAGRDVFYTWPSLVDHADEPTVIKGRGPSQGVRVAHEVGIPNWTGPEVRIQHTNNNFLGSKRDRV